MNLLDTALKNDVLQSVKSHLINRKSDIISANAEDLRLWQGFDQAMYDRLIVDDKKVDIMVKAVVDIIADNDPVGHELYRYQHPNNMTVVNRTAPFGTVMIIYESRPDVTIEAASVAFKSNNKILLKGGKEAKYSNRVLVECWHQALKDHGLDTSWVKLLELNRTDTQSFLKSPSEPLDLIVPRGGDGLINFVKANATCPVLISGRGNNFIYVHSDADWTMAMNVIINAKTDKISACNALDKVLINKSVPNLVSKINDLVDTLSRSNVQVLLDEYFREKIQGKNSSVSNLDKEWGEEYLAMKIAIGTVDNIEQAIDLINTHSGGHSNIIMSQNNDIASEFMNAVDAAAVYHNASSRFTDGGQFGLGAELAISTDKLHHRGPLGLHQLVTNKWYVYGNGQVR